MSWVEKNLKINNRGGQLFRAREYSLTECINSPMCRVESPTGLFQWFLVLQSVGLTQQQDYRYSGQDQCIVIPAFCRTIHTLVETIVS